MDEFINYPGAKYPYTYRESGPSKYWYRHTLAVLSKQLIHCIYKKL